MTLSSIRPAIPQLDSTPCNSVPLPTASERPNPCSAWWKSWSAGGVHFIQLREKDLDAAALQSLAREVMAKIDREPYQAAGECLLTRIGRDWRWRPAPMGSILPANLGSVRPAVCGSAFRSSARDAIISVPCHSLEDVEVAAKEQVDLMLFSPVFEKLSGSAAWPRVSKDSAWLARRRAGSRSLLWAG